MERKARIVEALFCALVCLVTAAPAAACNWWAVQAVIDFTYLKPRVEGNTGVHEIYKFGWRWDLASGDRPLEYYTVYDGDIFTPKPEQMDARIPFRIMAGGALLKKGPGADPDVGIDWYQLWAWEDTNNNGLADEGDRAQDWLLLRHYSEVPRTNEAFDVVQSSLELQAGKTYLLLVRACADGKTNLQFSGEVSVAWPYLEIVYWHGHGQEGWQSRGEGRFTNNWSPAVEDREVLWIRVNNPPAKPVVP
ncbi:MAG: hypothetical protein ACYTF6_09860 [Planctomycetota bacterium]|jgi:hypothetical protein